MGKIDSEKINYGNSYVISGESSRLSSGQIEDAKDIAKKIIEDAKQKALLIENAANSKAQEIIEKAKADADAQYEEITQTARQNGYDAGYKDGFEKIEVEMEDKLVNLNNFAQSQFEFKQRIIKSLHAEILDLVMELSKRVCAREFKTNPELIEKLTIAAVSSLKDKENITIIVNPQTAQKVYGISEKLKSLWNSLKCVKILEDPSVSFDGAIVESVNSRVDSRLCAQLNEVERELFDELNSVDENELVKESEENSQG